MDRVLESAFKECFLCTDPRTYASKDLSSLGPFVFRTFPRNDIFSLAGILLIWPRVLSYAKTVLKNLLMNSLCRLYQSLVI